MDRQIDRQRERAEEDANNNRWSRAEIGNKPSILGEVVVLRYQIKCNNCLATSMAALMAIRFCGCDSVIERNKEEEIRN